MQWFHASKIVLSDEDTRPSCADCVDFFCKLKYDTARTSFRLVDRWHP